MIKVEEDLLWKAFDALDKVLTDHLQHRKLWFSEQFRKDELTFDKNFVCYRERLNEGRMASQFPKGLRIHPLSLLMINAMRALGAIKSNVPFYYWRSYRLFVFWASAIDDASHLKGFRENISDRLRNSRAFAGAMFETLMASCLMRTSLVNVAFGDDPPDLLISDKKTMQQYALECKMLSGLTQNQENMRKLGDVFFDRVMSFLRKTSLSVFVWWAFDRVPTDSNASNNAAEIAIKLCEMKRDNIATSTLDHNLEKGLGRVIIGDLPEELTLAEDKTGDPKPPLTWRPPDVPLRGEIYCDRQTQLVNGKTVVSARIVLHLTQNPALKRNLEDNLDYARKQLGRLEQSKLKKVAVIGLRNEAPNRIAEAIPILSDCLIKHKELSGIIVVTSPTSAYTTSIVDCSDHTRIGLNSPPVCLSAIFRPGFDGNLPFKEVQVDFDGRRIITKVR